jgi:hypothetical protein
VLIYFRKKDGFSKFKNKDLENYKRFKEVILEFREYYKLGSLSLRQLDMYLWVLGKENFPST